MPVRFSCPHCLSNLTVSKRFAGRRGRCPNCKAKVQVPDVSIGDPLADDEDDQEETLASADFGASGESERIRHESDDGSRGRRSSRRPAARNRRRGARGDSTGGDSLTGRVALPRWIVYLQGALLGIVATTFFTFGLAVGTSTGGGLVSGAEAGNCVVSGSVYYDQGQERRADYGAVVILIPTDAAIRSRPPASGLRPDNFQPIDNEGIETIRGLGGSIVRADQDGKFETELGSNKSYWLLVISRNQRATNDSIGKQTRAEIGAFFLPIEELLGDRAFMWHKVRVSGQQQSLQVVTF